MSKGDPSPVFESGDVPPELSMIAEGGPAGRAGLRVGDRLTHIDGLSVTSPEGARRLGAVKPGDKVRLTVRRGTSTLNRDLTLGRRPEARAAVAAVRAAGPAARAAAAVAPSRAELRYTGKIDDVSVEVWSRAGSTVEKVGDTMVITVGGTIVRLKVDPKP
jgi:membrane-associated protease RseP (regulator of RpoE activity)